MTSPHLLSVLYCPREGSHKQQFIHAIIHPSFIIIRKGGQWSQTRGHDTHSTLTVMKWMGQVTSPHLHIGATIPRILDTEASPSDSRDTYRVSLVSPEGLHPAARWKRIH